MKYIGENGVSAYGVLMYIGFIFGSVFIGYNMGISQVISYKYGAGDKAELRSLLRKSCVLIGLAGLVITVFVEALHWLDCLNNDGAWIKEKPHSGRGILER